MATTFSVQGPTQIETDRVLANTFEPLGYAPNDQLISYQEEWFNIPLKSSRGGEETLDVIYAGKGARLNMVLIEWDVAQRDQIQEPPGGTTPGDAGSIGALWSTTGAGGTFFKVRIQPVDETGTDATETVLKPQYTFGKCYIDSTEILDIGNAGTMLGVSFIALRDSSGDIWTKVES